MPYNNDGNWLYSVDIPSTGDPLRVALYGLIRNVEAFLFDKRDPGYANTDFLSWAVKDAQVTHASSGTPANGQRRWHPDYAEDITALPEGANESGSRAYDANIHPDKVDFGTDAEPVPFVELADHLVSDPMHARFVNGDAVPAPVEQVDGTPDEPEAPEADPQPEPPFFPSEPDEPEHVDAPVYVDVPDEDPERKDGED